MLLLVEDLLLVISLEDQMLLILARNEDAIPICKSSNVCLNHSL
jgi:uncharacterized membrane protein YobD (UPF0266 family)